VKHNYFPKEKKEICLLKEGVCWHS